MLDDQPRLVAAAEKAALNRPVLRPIDDVNSVGPVPFDGHNGGSFAGNQTFEAGLGSEFFER